jgi:hypothetical protein
MLPTLPQQILENPFMSWITIISLGVFAVILFLALRQCVLWYFRLNQIADDLHVIADHYRSQAKAATPVQPTAGHVPAPRPTRPVPIP